MGEGTGEARKLADFSLRTAGRVAAKKSENHRNPMNKSSTEQIVVDFEALKLDFGGLKARFRVLVQLQRELAAARSERQPTAQDEGSK